MVTVSEHDMEKLVWNSPDNGGAIAREGRAKANWAYNMPPDQSL